MAARQNSMASHADDLVVVGAGVSACALAASLRQLELEFGATTRRVRATHEQRGVRERARIDARGRIREMDRPHVHARPAVRREPVQLPRAARRNAVQRG